MFDRRSERSRMTGVMEVKRTSHHAVRLGAAADNITL